MRLAWPPVQSALIVLGRTTIRMPKAWLDWFQQVADRVDQSPARLQVVDRAGLAASVGSTPIHTGAVAAGLYRVATYVRVTSPAGTSSSLQVTIEWTDGGVPQSSPGQLLTGNTTATVESRQLVVRQDANAPIRYRADYSSTGSPSMVYHLVVVLEQVA